MKFNWRNFNKVASLIKVAMMALDVRRKEKDPIGEGVNNEFLIHSIQLSDCNISSSMSIY